MKQNKVKKAAICIGLLGVGFIGFRLGCEATDIRIINRLKKAENEYAIVDFINIFTKEKVTIAMDLYHD